MEKYFSKKKVRFFVVEKHEIFQNVDKNVEFYKGNPVIDLYQNFENFRFFKFFQKNRYFKHCQFFAFRELEGVLMRVGKLIL